MQVQGDDDGVFLSPHYSLQGNMVLKDDKVMVGQAEKPQHVVVSMDEEWLAYFFNGTIAVLHKDIVKYLIDDVDVYRVDWVKDGTVCFSETNKRRWTYNYAKRSELSLIDEEYELRVFSVDEELYVIKQYDKYWVKDQELGFAPSWYDGKTFVE
jgi:hypothetical protein